LHDVVPSLVHYLFEYDTGIKYDALIDQASSDIKAIFASFAAPGSPYHVSEEAYAAARDVHLPALRDAFKRWFADNRVAAMIFPTTRIAATPIGQGQVEIGGEKVSYNDAISRNIASGSTAGLPGLVLPVGMTKDGLPASLEFDGPSDRDRQMLALGLAVERLLDRLPPPRCGA
jgi:mandelamide amidase